MNRDVPTGVDPMVHDDNIDAMIFRRNAVAFRTIGIGFANNEISSSNVSKTV